MTGRGSRLSEVSGQWQSAATSSAGAPLPQLGGTASDVTGPAGSASKNRHVVRRRPRVLQVGAARAKLAGHISRWPDASCDQNPLQMLVLPQRAMLLRRQLFA